MKAQLRYWIGAIALLFYNSGICQVPVFEPKHDSGITEVSDIGNFVGHGASAADFDNDGDIDLYIATITNDRDRIYKNDGDGTFVDVTDAVGVNITSASRMAVWFDFNNDHLLDLVILGERCAGFNCIEPILINLLRQTEEGTFVDVTALSGLTFGDKYNDMESYVAGGMAVGDINNDGDLDLLVTVWGGKSSLFLNNGDATFTDISESSSIGTTKAHFWQPMFHDFDDDGYIDIYMNVDFDRNQLWINRGDNSFNEIAAEVGLASDFNEMGMAINDYDNDGDFDIYCTNITRKFEGFDEHNVLLRNDSEAGFIVFNEIGLSAAVGNSGWDWGTTFFDANNDGWVDLASTNGWNVDPAWGPDQSHFWMNTSGNFSDQSLPSMFNDHLSATTLIALDADRDGDLDLLQTLKDESITKLPAILYENLINETPHRGNYLVLQPRMKDKNHWAIGAEIKVKAPNYFNMRLISAGSSFYGQEPVEAFFGLGNLEKVMEAEILWPDGTISVYEDVPANQVVKLMNDVIYPPSDIEYNLAGGAVTIHWIDNADNETGFRIQKSADKNFTTVESVIVAENQITYTETFDFGKPYYRIKALNESVTSPYSQHIKVVPITSISAEQNAYVTVYPNPSKGFVNVDLSDFQKRRGIIKVFDSSGKTINYQDIDIESDDMSIVLDLSKHVGLVLIRIQIGETTINKRISLVH